MAVGSFKNNPLSIQVHNPVLQFKAAESYLLADHFLLFPVCIFHLNPEIIQLWTLSAPKLRFFHRLCHQILSCLRRDLEFTYDPSLIFQAKGNLPRLRKRQSDLQPGIFVCIIQNVRTQRSSA